MVKFFEVILSASNPDKYIIKYVYEGKSNFDYVSGSYNVLMARLTGLSYGDFLRYCRDSLGADLIGKNSFYIIPYFNNKETPKDLIFLLNQRLNNLILS